jgi:hypothetical protein
MCFVRAHQPGRLPSRTKQSYRLASPPPMEIHRMPPARIVGVSIMGLAMISQGVLLGLGGCLRFANGCPFVYLNTKSRAAGTQRPPRSPPALRMASAKRMACPTGYGKSLLPKASTKGGNVG